MSHKELADLRNQLTTAYQFQLLERDGRRILFIRSARPEPDPVTDLEACLERLPDAAVHDPDHLVLLGTGGDLHIAGATLRPLLDRRRLLDRMAVAHWRATLPVPYEYGIHRVAGDPASLVRLGIRIPRTRCLDLNEPDLLNLATHLGPALDAGDLDLATAAYLVADDDHVRLSMADLVADLAPRWRAIQATPPPPPPREPEPEPVPEEIRPAPAAPVRRRPQRTVRVRPALELHAQADATPPEVDFDPILTNQAIAGLETRLKSAEFDVMQNVAHGDHPFVLAAERPSGYPRRVLVQSLARFAKADATTALRTVRDLEADLLLIVSPTIDPDAQRRTLVTKVKVVTPAEADTVRF